MAATTPDEQIRLAAAQWTVRRDRGLSASESIEFELWLAADPRHAAAMRSVQRAWTLLDATPEPVAQRELAATARRRGGRRAVLVLTSLAAAAVLAIGTWRWLDRPARPPVAPALLAAGPRLVTLADGSVVRLNAGGEVSEDFSPGERRVRLLRGEAHFSVEPDASRPFVVAAGALRVRAVGTAFNVHLDGPRIEVVVTHGKVRVASAARTAAVEPLVEAGQKAVLATDAPAPAIVVSPVDAAELSRTVAWHDSLLRLGGATLGELAQDFEKRFGQRMIVAEPEVAALRAGGRLPGDDAESFAKVLATTFDLEVGRTPEGAWVLRKKKPDPR